MKKIHQGRDSDLALPDDILILVLSRLNIEEAARTSILSHRWENLWKFYEGSLEFVAGQYYPGLDYDYVVWVNEVLRSHQGHTIEGLKISFDFWEVEYMEWVDRWFEFAFSKGARRLEFNLWPSHTGRFPLGKPGISPHPFPSSVRDFSRIRALTWLRLKWVDLTDEVVDLFLSNCPMLGHFSVDDAPSLLDLTFNAGNSPNLMHLEIINCLGLKNLQVSAPNLVFFKFWGPEINLLVDHLPKLSSVSLGGMSIMTQFRSSAGDRLPFPASSLEELVLNIPLRFKYNIFLDSRPEFTEVRELELDFKADADDFLCLSSLVHSCRRLEKLVLRYKLDTLGFKRRYSDDNFAERQKNVMSQHKYEYVKEVECYGWRGLKADFEFATYLVKAATALEKFIITPWQEEIEAFKCRASQLDYEAAKCRARNLESEFVSSRAKLIIL